MRSKRLDGPVERLATTADEDAEEVVEGVKVAVADEDWLLSPPPPSIVMGMMNSRGDLRIIAGSRFATVWGTATIIVVRLSVAASADCD